MLLAMSSLNNARLVSRIGVTLLVRRMAVIGVVIAALLLAVSFRTAGKPNFWLFTVVLALTVPLAQGTVPNANTAAMMPVPHVAGTAIGDHRHDHHAGGALLGDAGVRARSTAPCDPFAVGTS